MKLFYDGVVLCQLVNLFYDNRIEKIYISKPGKLDYQRIENINAFIEHCNDIGVQQVFQTLDLFEGKNAYRVVNCVYGFIQMIDQGIKSRRIKRKQAFTIEEMANAHEELQKEKEATGEPISMILAESINPNLNETLLEDPMASDTSSTYLFTPKHKNLHNSTFDMNRTPITTPQAIQYSVTNSNTYESNNISILNTKHQRTTIINTPYTKFALGLNQNDSSSLIESPNINNITDIRKLDSPYTSNHDSSSINQLATTSTITSASISTIPIRIPIPVSSNNFLTNSIYKSSNFQQNSNNNNNLISHTPYKEPIALNEPKLRLSDLNTKQQQQQQRNNIQNNYSLQQQQQLQQHQIQKNIIGQQQAQQHIHKVNQYNNQTDIQQQLQQKYNSNENQNFKEKQQNYNQQQYQEDHRHHHIGSKPSLSSSFSLNNLCTYFIHFLLYIVLLVMIITWFIIFDSNAKHIGK
ncbi:hypothetical protein CYY_003198 [Polysphondylium violaceum]|uniref:Calponin-homology (CH) domain-containing protein n=1 Tax=Polysphondylium violaceum TaxID=133409 RepID=A0A8J4Q745_9MYCE|nr:hypothetical protein CYY_003198 [Polysphondylium violaceum]